MENKHSVQADEVDIKDYMKVIIKRKVLILAILIASIIVTAITSFRMDKIYEVTSIIQIGGIKDPLVKNEDVKVNIMSKHYLLAVIDDLKIKITPEDLANSIKINEIKDTNLLKLRITYADADKAVQINEAIANLLISKGQVAYQARVAIIKKRLKELYTAIERIEDDIANTKNLIAKILNASNVSSPDDSMKIMLLQNLLSNHEAKLGTFCDRRDDLESVIINAKDFMIFDAPIKPEYPIAPNKNQNILVGGICGLLLGCFFAFALEFWQNK